MINVSQTTAMVRAYVAFASALAFASCVDADVPAFCAGPVWPKPFATHRARPICLSMVGKDYQLDLSDHSGRTRDLLLRQSAKQASYGYGGYDPKRRILQSAPSPHYPEPKHDSEPYGGYESESHVSSVLSAPFDVEADVSSLTPSRSIFDALDRIKSDSIARLDAANNIVPTIHRFASSERVELLATHHDGR